MISPAHRKLIVVLIAVVLLLGVSASATVAWFTAILPVSHEPMTGSSIANYFARGDGKTEESAYVIKTARHVYNLAWLQNTGAFAEKTVYFKLEAPDASGVIDMAGALNGYTGDVNSGAVPPIGTTENPFTGIFDGNGVVIKNLWVSSDPADWKERPANYEDYLVTEDVGFFGYAAGAANISDFYLENVEVTSHIDGAKVGVVVGKLDASLSEVGVKNAKVNVGNGGSATSQYALIGELVEGVIWEDKPTEGSGGEGNGDIVINPSATRYGGTSSGTAEVTGAGAFSNDPYFGNSETAYFIKSISSSTVSGGLSSGNLYVYNTHELTFTANTKTTAYGKNGTSDYVRTTSPTSGANEDEEFNLFLEEAYSPYGGKSAYSITFANTPDFSNLTTGTCTGDAANTGVKYPSNCVWFKPQSTGTCVIAFTKQNNSQDEYMALYRYKRNANGTVDQTTKQEMIFQLARALNNKSLVYFEVKLTKQDLGYEYVIGKSTVSPASTTAGFFYLRLAGSSEEAGGGGEGELVKTLKRLDFVDNTNVDFETYVVHKSLLSFEAGTTNAVRSYYFNALTTGFKTHYSSQNVATGEALVETISAANAQSQKEDTVTATTFPARETTSSG